MHAMSLRDADPEVIDELADCQYCGENVELRLLDNHEEKCAAKNEGQSKEDFQHYSAANAKGNAKTKAVKENNSRFKNSSGNSEKHKAGASQRSRRPVNKDKRRIDTEDKPRFPHQ
ncbi:hypothetical protein EB796_017285 [Bugula neritina]|uniref:Uncharacterized protein n=1 Tax=Bugula neritina TaxID=10212 RepID=A0A7J7JEV6_BUGNE|nr:hypothetical protein EB796_017285 [Bugula neritina]